MEPDLEHERGGAEPFSRKGRASRAPWDPPPRPVRRSDRRRNPDHPYDDDDMRRGTD
jgi:hypothetical protein